MSGKVDWHAASMAGYEVWLRELHAVTRCGEALSLAVWPARGQSAWEWEGRTFPTYVFDTPGQVIWGATARILRGFLDALESPAARTG